MGFLITSIKDTTQDTVRVTALGCLQKVDIQMGTTRIIMDKEDLECYILGLQDIAVTPAFTGVAFSLTTAPPTENHFCPIFQSHIQGLFHRGRVQHNILHSIKQRP
jgi:hypothetical protein